MGLSADEVAKVKQAFQNADVDGDGVVSSGDLDTLFRSYGWNLNDEDIAELISRIDSSGSGQVTYDQFLAFCETRPIKKRIEARIKEIFAKMDTDGSGFVTADDLKNGLTEAGFYPQYITDDMIAAAIGRCDPNGDGKVSYDDFVKYLQTA